MPNETPIINGLIPIKIELGEKACITRQLDYSPLAKSNCKSKYNFSDSRKAICQNYSKAMSFSLLGIQLLKSLKI